MQKLRLIYSLSYLLKYNSFKIPCKSNHVKKTLTFPLYLFMNYNNFLTRINLLYKRLFLL